MVPPFKSKPKRETVWKGPEESGITFSLLCRFLSCRERFRLLVVEGLKPEESFDHRIEYGHLWHTCEEAVGKGEDWKPALTKYARMLALRYSDQRQLVDHWYEVCKVQFPYYLDFWKKHPSTLKRKTLLSEQVFDVPYQLPSGRTVRLRGKWDGIDLIGEGKKAGIYVWENKTKGQIIAEQIVRQLTWDLQTMLYIVALVSKRELLTPPWTEERSHGDAPIKGVIYNVVRRPLSGGKGTIVRKKATKNHEEESKEDYYQRVGSYIADEPHEYFMRWTVDVTPEDVTRFRRECLDPILENLCHWWDHQSGACDPTEATRGIPPSHWRHPFGVRNIMDEGGISDYDHYLTSGSGSGLRRVDNLFPELE